MFESSRGNPKNRHTPQSLKFFGESAADQATEYLLDLARGLRRPRAGPARSEGGKPLNRKRKPWCAVPVEPLIALLPSLKWRTANGAPASTNAAALILYVTLIFVADARESGDPATVMYRATATYSELGTLTGLSRALIAAGLKRLIELNLVAANGANQKRLYLIQGSGGRWFKLPCLACLTREGSPRSVS